MELYFSLFAIGIFNKTYVIMLSHNLEIPMQRFRDKDFEISFDKKK